jgi:tetratricopeptide (TPR) repeat protein
MASTGQHLPATLASAQAALDEAQYADALTAAYRALTEPRIRASRPWLAQVHYILGRAAHELGEDHESRDHFEQASSLALEAKAEVLALHCQLALSQCDHRAGDLATALHGASLVLAAARERELPELEAGALTCIGNIAWKRGDLPAALGDLERAAALYEKQGEEMQALRARMSAGYVRTMLGEVPAGRAQMQVCLAYFLEANDHQAAAKTLSNLAFTYYAEGELAEARDLLLRSTELDERHCNRQLSLAAWYNLGLIELAQDWRAAAQHSFTRAYALSQLLGDRTTENMSLLYLGVLALLAHQPAEALHFLQLGHTNFSGMEVQERRIADYFLIPGLIASDNEEAARELWDRRTALAQLTDCLDDFELIVRVLKELLGHEYRQAFPLSNQAQFTAGRMLDTLERELLELTVG